MENTAEKLRLKTKIGYGIGAIGEVLAYNFVIMFLIFYLVSIAGISPLFAGTISFIAILWDAITDPIIGIMSDKIKTRHGTKRAFMGIAAVPLGIIMLLLFSNFNLSGIARNIYYVAFALLFWTAFTVFSIPYYSIGASITNNPDETVKLMSVRQIFAMVGTFAAGTLPLLIVDRFMSGGFTESFSWTIAAAVLGTIVATTSLITWKATKGKEPLIKDSNDQQKGLKHFFDELKEIFTIKPYIVILVSVIFFMIGFTIWFGNVMFYIIHILGKGESEAALVFGMISVFGIVTSLVLGKMAVKYDKFKVFMAILGITAVSFIVGKFLNINSIPALIVYIFFMQIGVTGYYVLIYSLVYDIADIDEFKTAKRREGSILSFYMFVTKFGSAVGAQLLGAFLGMNGFGAELVEQPESALAAIDSMNSIYPGIMILISVIIFTRYTVTKKRHAALKKAIVLKQEGRPCSTDGFNEII